MQTSFCLTLAHANLTLLAFLLKKLLNQNTQGNVLNSFFSGSPHDGETRSECWGVAADYQGCEVLWCWPVWVSDKHQSCAQPHSQAGCCRWALSISGIITCQYFPPLHFFSRSVESAYNNNISLINAQCWILYAVLKMFKQNNKWPGIS